MKAFLICPLGFEDVSAQEVSEILSCKTETSESVVIFDVKKYEDLCKIAYKCQSGQRVSLLLEKTKRSKIDKIKFTDVDSWFDKETKFRIKGHVVDNDKITTNELEIELAKVIGKHKVDLENPDITFYAYLVKEDLYFGIDFSGFDTSKRRYKLFSMAASLNGSFAYSLVRLSGFDKGNLLDCFSGSGMIPIEAALYISGKSPNFYNKKDFAFLKLKPLQDFDFDKLFETWDKESTKKAKIISFDSSMPAVKACQKNAKIAGINKLIEYSKVDVEWLDTKFKQGEIDHIVTNPPMISKRTNKKQMERLYKEFFHQADYVLNKKGRIVLCVSSKESIDKLKDLSSENFKVVSEREAWQGGEQLYILVLEKS